MDVSRLRNLFYCIEQGGVALPFPIHDCTLLLTQKVEDNNTTLLQLSATRQLFSLPREDACWTQLQKALTTDSQYQLIETLMDKVSAYADNQFINFCASKALLSIMVHPNTSSKLAASITESLLSKLIKHTPTGQGVTYSLQTVVEALKQLRKSDWTEKRGVCMEAATAWWPRVVQYFTTSSSSSSSSSHLCTHQGTHDSANYGQSIVAQELLQLVSLTVECLRAMKPITLRMVKYTRAYAGSSTSPGHGHPSPSTEDQVTPFPEPSSFCDIVVPKLPLLGKAVASSNCSHSFIKLADVVNKCLKSCSLDEKKRKELLDHVEVLFTAGVLCWSPITKDALRSWFDREGKLVYRLLMLECGVAVEEWVSEWFSASLPQSTSDTILRKYLVLLLQVQVTACCHGSSSGHTTEALSLACISDLFQAMKQLYSDTCQILPESLLPLLLQRSLIQIVSGHDSSLVQAFTACLQLQRKDDLPSEIAVVLDIHCLLITFLRSISFDYSVLLDLIISPETRFDSFLDQYLDLLSTGMPQLVAACKNSDALINSSNASSAHNIPSTLPHLPPLPHKRDRAELEESQNTLPKALKLSDPHCDSTDSTSTEQSNLSPISTSDSGSEDSIEEEEETIASVTTVFANLSHLLAKLHTAEDRLLPAPKSNIARVIHHKIESIILGYKLT